MSVQENYLKDIADAIREREGTAGPIPAKEFAERIRALPSGTAGDISCLRFREYAHMTVQANGIGTIKASADRIARAIILFPENESIAHSGVLIAYMDDSGWLAEYRNSSSINFGPRRDILDIEDDFYKWAVYPDGMGGVTDWWAVLLYDE